MKTRVSSFTWFTACTIKMESKNTLQQSRRPIISTDSHCKRALTAASVRYLVETAQLQANLGTVLSLETPLAVCIIFEFF